MSTTLAEKNVGSPKTAHMRDAKSRKTDVETPDVHPTIADPSLAVPYLDLLREGPLITKLGRRILYRRSSLQAWLRSREHQGNAA
jgi:hypothetical protein